MLYSWACGDSPERLQFFIGVTDTLTTIIVHNIVWSLDQLEIEVFTETN